MDPIAVLQNRIEQLEAKLGLQNANLDGQQGDSATTNLLNAASAMNNATAGHEKLTEAMQHASELNNYTDPNIQEKMQQNVMDLNEVIAGEPVIRHHCQCIHRCKQAAPALESEAIAQAPQMQAKVDSMLADTANVKIEADAVSQGVQELAESCGAAAASASQELADVAQKVEQVEEKLFKRRNGLD